MSCLFNSLNYFIKIGSNNIRQHICNYLQQNKPIIDGLETRTVLQFENNNQYISNMRSQSTWGGGVEIAVACNIWKLRIIVKNYRHHRTRNSKDIEFLPVKGRYNKTIELYWTGNHFEPIR